MRKKPIKNNRSGITGVVWKNNRSKWEAQIKMHGKNLFLGQFQNMEDAVKARRDAELEYYGRHVEYDTPTTTV